MPRIDHSDYIIHFTKGATDEEAYTNFKSIVSDGRINCGTGFIIHPNCCICFTEAPLNCLNENDGFKLGYFGRYNPFGFLFTKKYIANLGGRHVIYSPENERDQIPDELKWRYVKYEPNENPRPIDFTWEREWRLNIPSLELNPQHVKLILPNRGWINRFQEDHFQEQHLLYQQCQCNRESLVYQYQQLFDQNYAEQIVDNCPSPQQLPYAMIGMTDSLDLNFRA